MALVGWIAGGYAALVVGAAAVQRTFIYPAPRAAVAPRMSGGTLHRIGSNGPRTVFAFHMPAPEGQRTIVHFHGNGEALADQIPLVAALHGRGFGVYAVEYPGYGLARAARPTENAFYEDAEHALVHLRETLGVPVESTVVQGHSLGAGVAVEMATRGHAARAILLSPFTSMAAMVRRIAPFLPASLVVRDRYDNLAKAPSLLVPTLIVHGERDQVVPASMGRRLGATLPNARIYISPSAGHNDLLVIDGERVLDAIDAFARDELP